MAVRLPGRKWLHETATTSFHKRSLGGLTIDMSPSNFTYHRRGEGHILHRTKNCCAYSSEYTYSLASRCSSCNRGFKPAFHDADTDTDILRCRRREMRALTRCRTTVWEQATKDGNDERFRTVAAGVFLLTDGRMDGRTAGGRC